LLLGNLFEKKEKRKKTPIQFYWKIKEAIRDKNHGCSYNLLIFSKLTSMQRAWINFYICVCVLFSIS